MNKAENSVLIRSFRLTSTLLNKSQKLSGIFIIILLLTNAVLDVFSIASVLPLVALLLNPELIHSNNLLKSIYNFSGISNSTDFFILITTSVIVLFIIKNIISYWIFRYQSKYAFDVSAGLSGNLLNHFYTLPFLKIKYADTSMYLNRIVNIPPSFVTNILLSLLTIFSEGLIVILISSGLLIYSFDIFLLLLLILGPGAFIYYLIRKKKLSVLNYNLKTKLPKVLRLATEAIKGFVESTIFQKQKHFTNKFDEINKGLNNDYSKLTTAQGTSIKFVEIIIMMGIGILFIYSNLFIDNKNEVVLILSLFAAASYKIVPSINRIFVSFLNIKTHQFTLDELNDIENFKTALSNKSHQPISVNDKIELNNVSFEYPSSSFKLNVKNFKVKKGEKVGIRGLSGSGKSTLINIFIGLISIQKGEFLIDGNKINSDEISEWQKLIGYVGQNPFIFNDSLLYNIAFDYELNSDDQERINKTLNFLNLDNLVQSLPDGLNTNIGEEGSKLSGGQKQRIAIARALFPEREILIFDEITSNLDKETEKEVIQTILKVAKRDKTIIFVSHKDEILNTCDKIYRVENGDVFLDKEKVTSSIDD